MSFWDYYLAYLEKSQSLHLSRGIVRNRNGEWIIGFNRLLESCSVFEAELWGILDGLWILIDQGCSVVAIQTDNLKVAKAIQERPIGESNLTLIRMIHYLLVQLDHWSISYISRMDNQEADTLVKLAHEGRYSLQVFETSLLGGLG
ncbi:uncharacterized protein [Gossypium hirsutum]|uniref:RNase H type-1 domain-containing protein n=1 Tax=Gossypium hirsutum TaxID=3635 RepID=A0A1U8M2U0_GOSHI|nr:uncharacterized protein LOC107933425 [Gossypium hirsutum]